MLGVMVVLMVLALLAGFVATNGGPAGLAVGLLLAMLVFICFALGQLFSIAEAIRQTKAELKNELRELIFQSKVQ